MDIGIVVGFKDGTSAIIKDAHLTPSGVLNYALISTDPQKPDAWYLTKAELERNVTTVWGVQ